MKKYAFFFIVASIKKTDKKSEPQMMMQLLEVRFDDKYAVRKMEIFFYFFSIYSMLIKFTRSGDIIYGFFITLLHAVRDCHSDVDRRLL